MPTIDRERGYGYLFGYPDHAVDFFCDARQQWTESGEFVKRDFVSIQTYGPNGTVWAVPKGQQDHAENKEFFRRAEEINNVYRGLRNQSGDDHLRLLGLVRKWKAANVGKSDK